MLLDLEMLIKFIESQESIAVNFITDKRVEEKSASLFSMLTSLLQSKPPHRRHHQKRVKLGSSDSEYSSTEEYESYKYAWILNGIPEDSLPATHLYAGRGDYYSLFGGCVFRLEPIIKNNEYLGLTIDLSFKPYTYPSNEVTHADLNRLFAALEINNAFATQIRELILDGQQIREKIVFPANLINLNKLSMKHMSTEIDYQFVESHWEDTSSWHLSDWDGERNEAPDLSHLPNLQELYLHKTRLTKWPIFKTSLELICVGLNAQTLPPQLPKSVKYYLQCLGETIPHLSHTELPNLVKSKFYSKNAPWSRSILRPRVENLLEKPTLASEICISRVDSNRISHFSQQPGHERLSKYDVGAVELNVDILEQHFDHIERCFLDTLQREPTALIPVFLPEFQVALYKYLILVISVGMLPETALSTIAFELPTMAGYINQSALGLQNILADGNDHTSMDVLSNYIRTILPGRLQKIAVENSAVNDKIAKLFVGILNTSIVKNIISSATTRKNTTSAATKIQSCWRKYNTQVAFGLYKAHVKDGQEMPRHVRDEVSSKLRLDII